MFFYKFLILGFPVKPDITANVWNVEARISFEAHDRPVKVSMYIPRNTRRFAITNENFISRGYGLTTRSEQENRRATWSIRSARGKQVLYYRAVIRQATLRELPKESKKLVPESPGFEGLYLAAVQALLADIRKRSADTETLVAELMKLLNSAHPDENTALLLGTRSSMAKRIELAVRILAQADVPARMIHGIRLEELRREARVVHWLQVYDGRIWRSFNPDTGLTDIPDDWFPWWRGSHPLGEIEGSERLKITLSVSLDKDAALNSAIERSRFIAPHLVDFSLFNLPIETQTVYHVLFMVPLGAFLLVILRNIVGVKTFGTFMPVLIALAFRETKLLWGIILFITLVALGLSIRFYFERLKLLLVPRLASLLMVVILLMAAMSIVSNKIGLERGLSVALFPMVILTMTIERMSIVWEERGAGEALQQGFGSIVVAIVAYLVITNKFIEHFIFIFPETLLVLLACTVMLGRYSGYRLLELYRFKTFARRPPDA